MGAMGEVFAATYRASKVEAEAARRLALAGMRALAEKPDWQRKRELRRLRKEYRAARAAREGVIRGR